MNELPSNESILIVDDKPGNLHLLAVILERYGYRLRLLTEGQAVMRAVLELPPDLILLDIMMPDIDGFEVCRQLKADARTSDIPIIFLSALTDISEKIKAFSLGATDYITKPFQQEEVLLRVKTQLALKEAQTQLRTHNLRLQQEIHERKQAEAILQQRNRELAVLNHFGEMLGSSLELHDVLFTALQEMQSLLQAVSASIWLFTADRQELECREILGPGSDQLRHARLPLGSGITGWVAEHGESILSSNILEDPRHHKTVGSSDDAPVRSMLSVPLKVKSQVIGVLNLVDPRVGRFTKDDLRFIEPIAASAAMAIENARLYTTAQQEIAERTRAEAELREANASKDKFFSIISHDLRSPLNTMMGFAELLISRVEHDTKDEIKRRAEKIHASAKRLHTLLENLLTWARIQRGALEYHPEAFSLSEVADEILDLFGENAEQNQVTLEHAISSHTGVYADYSMIYTVLRNLVSNALKFTPNGGSVRLSARLLEQDVEIAVADTGVGIPQADVAQLFRIDAHYTHVGTRGETGTGLGLVLCKELVEKNGGRIWVESESGSGTRFFFTLPGCAFYNG
ncbi:response regulator receiver sensor signal transduction histidine kinase [Candidatus Moduliflexus flocculans]|uniref:histidine kinase n=1 Tax=Candidatus Moduliflexus flocculans TaxID=1499966 RepID=A0A081BN15_9BACT|nr:response regulator receiver sensor signal transduction histidine kinase [Candidatus Moduliflexus flocculans]